MLSHWANTNGFKFSSSKTVCIHFCRLRNAHQNPELKLNGTPIPVAEQTKFLGFIFDNKLTFLPHIRYLKEKCLKALNLLRVVAHTSWWEAGPGRLGDGSPPVGFRGKVSVGGLGDRVCEKLKQNVKLRYNI